MANDLEFLKSDTAAFGHEGNPAAPIIVAISTATNTGRFMSGSKKHSVPVIFIFINNI